jgi:hypothetical protein
LMLSLTIGYYFRAGNLIADKPKAGISSNYRSVGRIWC